MPVNTIAYQTICQQSIDAGVTLIAVSKTKPIDDILALYDLGQRDFGENYVQELVGKHEILPKDIRWHFIGHLQSNKAKYIAPFVHLVHGVDSEKLLSEINKQGKKNNQIINCLLQVHIAQEETKFGFDDNELIELLNSGRLNELKNVTVKGLMGMASFTEDKHLIEKEFRHLKSLFDKAKTIISSVDTLSMGMSADYELAISVGSNMIRVGSLLFGARNYG
jgi:pyridoxal phosphate enzyme (YggS family)